MKFHKKLNKELGMEDLPRSYQAIGNIIILKLKKNLYSKRKLIGKTILKILPRFKTVVLDKGISGKKRKPKIEIIAGVKETLTLHKEIGCKYWIDVEKVMFSKGNKGEKERIFKMIRKKEVVVDMFAGMGYWSVLIGKKAKMVYAIDINPDAIKLLEKNVFLNKVEDKVKILKGDCRKFAKILGKVADRIIMGYLFNTEEFLPYALKMAKKGCIIHFHTNLVEEEIEKFKFPSGVKVLRYRKIKSYAPTVWHVVFDLEVRK